MISLASLEQPTDSERRRIPRETSPCWLARAGGFCVAILKFAGR